ncbi:MAG: Arabinose efflux permease [Rhodospirillales bacterium]|nr:Arabinose efflux permease [Rhodospirillales bacterium]
MSAASQLTPVERRITLLVAAVQFVNVLDFMMVLPLGPDFAVALGIPTSHLGYIGGAYTLAAFVSGLAGALVLDRFDRRQALAVAIGGLVIATALGGFAVDLPTMLGARMLAGFFGGPATSLALAIIADSVPPERRGRAMGMVSASFAVTSVVGMPIGLELARLGGWRLPFFGVAGLGAVIAFLVVWAMPPQRAHLQQPGGEAHRVASFGELLAQPMTRLAMLLVSLAIVTGFMLFPNFSAWIQFNLGFPRAQIGVLYMLGGCIGFFVTRYVGIGIDKFGGAPIAIASAVLNVVMIWAVFLTDKPPISLYVIFPLFMAANAARMVVVSTITSKVPGPTERARFMSLTSATQHISSAFAAFLASAVLIELPGGALAGIMPLAVAAMVLATVVPPLVWSVERFVDSRSRSLRVQTMVETSPARS